jgi:hypothetical protein
MSRSDEMREYHKLQMREWRKNHPGKDTQYWNTWRERNPEYNMGTKKVHCTHAEYLQMVEDQAGVCAICREAEKDGRPLSVDHDHRTGRNRGLLCHRCNVALGGFQDDVQLIQWALEYLSKEV